MAVYKEAKTNTWKGTERYARQTSVGFRFQKAGTSKRNRAVGDQAC